MSLFSDQPVPAAPRFRALPALSLLLTALLLIFLRAPAILLTGRFWAEEGKIYFLDARLGSWWDALLAPRTGYYSGWTKLAALTAAAVPLEWAPMVTVYAALAVQLIVVLFVARSDAFAGPAARVLAVAAVLLAVPSAEVWLNTANSQFHFALGAAVLLVTSPGAVPAALRLGFLVLAATSGPVSTFLAPCFLWRAWRQPSQLFLAEAAIVGLGALFQGWLVTSGLQAGDRTGAFALPALAAMLGIKLLALPWFGPWSNGLAQILVSGDPVRQCLVVTVLAGIGGLLAAVLLQPVLARYLAAVALLLAFLSCAGALTVDPWLMVTPLFGGRYVYAPNALLALALVASAMDPHNVQWRQTVASVLLAGVLVQGAADYNAPSALLIGPNWREEVTDWRARADKPTVAIWPTRPDMQLTLPRSLTP
jgi:hypothetical protein